ncbi:hypothetical protein ACF0H5_005067 [Mactra antiquata]
MLNRTSIEEANKHLQALYKRVGELEEIVQEQHDALQAKDSFIQAKIQELSQQDIQIQNIQSQLYEKDKLVMIKNDEIEHLTQDIDDKSKEISFLKQQNRSLNDFMKLASDLKLISTKFDSVVETVHDSVRYGYNDTTESPNDGGYDSTFHNRNDDDDDDDDDDGEYTDDDEDSESLNEESFTQDKDQTVSHKLPGTYCERTNYEHDNDGAGGDFRNNHVTEISKENEKIFQYSTSSANDQHASGDSLQQHTFPGRKSKFSISEESDYDENAVVLNSSTSSQKEVYF